LEELQTGCRHVTVLPERKEGMQPSVDFSDMRERILLLKEIPPLPLVAQKILCMEPDADVDELADIIGAAPCLAARILGLANSAYFGWPGGVRTVYDAIYKVLGIKLVKSLAIGMALSSEFDVNKCKGFQPERYWFTAIVTAQLSQALFSSLDQSLRCQLDNIHMGGLLHNLGLSVLCHVFPLQLSQAFCRPVTADSGTTTCCIREAVGIDHLQAGSWLARKWHLPADIIRVMEFHKDSGYRGEYWPITVLVGYCERQSQLLFKEGIFRREQECEHLLGIDDALMVRVCDNIEGQLEDLLSMASLMATGDSNG
jgi:HD-like signal output (HDOD) protein